jgi:hypothetical protein
VLLDSVSVLPSHQGASSLVEMKSQLPRLHQHLRLLLQQQLSTGSIIDDVVVVVVDDVSKSQMAAVRSPFRSDLILWSYYNLLP